MQGASLLHHHARLLPATCPARLRHEPFGASQPAHVSRAQAAGQPEAAAAPPRGFGEVVAVESLEGVRVQMGDSQQPIVEYLVGWKVCTLKAM